MLIYDGERRGCTQLATTARSLLPLGIPVVAWQDLPDLAVLGLDPVSAASQPWWIGVDGIAHGGAGAVSRCLAATKRWWSPLATALDLPLVRPATLAVVRLAATTRARQSSGNESSRTA